MIVFNLPVTEIRFRYLHLELVHRLARAAYTPKTYPGKITFFQTHENQDITHRKWANLADEKIEVHAIPGDHLNMIQEPHVQVLAKKLRDCLDKEQGARI